MGIENVHAAERIIKDLKNDDIRVQITGYVRQLKDNQFMLDDETGNIEVDFKTAENYMNGIKEGDLVNVIGELILSVGGEMSIKAEIIQNMNKLNFKYHQKLYELKKELE